MPIQHIYTFLAHPRKGSEKPPEVNGASVALNGRLFELLDGIYGKSDQECDIDITFLPAANGTKQNDCRDLLCEFIRHPTIGSARAVARRLESKTDARSGLGLLFLISGKEGKDQKVLLSRFPTDNAIHVDEDARNLKVEFLERVFMKNKASYKAVAYQDASLKGGFWNGRAVDKQLNNPAGHLSNYWILDFLASEFTVTAAAGTRRLAIALLNAAKKVGEIEVKMEITAAATLAARLAGQRLSMNDFFDRYALSQAARAAISAELKSPRLVHERFEFDLVEFQNIAAFKTVELSNGGTLTAPSAEFDRVFRKEVVDRDEQRMRFVTEGKVVNEKLKARA